MLKEIEKKRVIKIQREDGFEQHIVTDMTQKEVEEAMNGYDFREESLGLEEKLNKKASETAKSWDYLEVLAVEEW